MEHKMEHLQHNRPLKSYNTFGLEATARHWGEFKNAAELQQIIAHCQAEQLDWYVLSGGSNIILTDTFEGVYLHPTGRSIEWDAKQGILVADAGVEWDALVADCVERGLWGLECLSLIPGLVGAAPVQNIGAYGAEAGDCIRWVEYLDTESIQICRIEGCACAFGYRTSVFKTQLRGRAIVLRVAFALQASQPETLNLNYGQLAQEIHKRGGISLQNIRESVMNIRRSKLPDPVELGNAGSFFKNPVVDADTAARIRAQYPTMPSFETPEGIKIPAGWLIDTAGWKGFRDGAVGVHQHQALVIVNYGGGTATQIIHLARSIRDDIFARFGIELEMEVNVL